MYINSDTKEIYKVGGFEYEICLKNHLYEDNHRYIQTDLYLDGIKYKDLLTVITKPESDMDYLEKRCKTLVNDLKEILDESPRDRLIQCVENNRVRTIGIAYFKKPKSIKVEIKTYIDYEEVGTSDFNLYGDQLSDLFKYCKFSALFILEELKNQVINKPSHWYEVYGVNGFVFTIGAELIYGKNELSNEIMITPILDGKRISKPKVIQRYKNNIVSQISEIVNEIEDRLKTMCPKNIEKIYSIGDGVKVKAYVQFNKDADSSIVRINAFLDNMVYNVSMNEHFDYKITDKIIQAGNSLLEDIKGFLDTFPKSTRDLVAVRDCKYLLETEISKEPGDNIFNVSLKLDHEPYDEMKIPYNINNIYDVKKMILDKGNELYKKLKSDTPNDIISDYNKNDMDFTIHAHFYKKAGDSDIKIEYRIENNKK